MPETPAPIVVGTEGSPDADRAVRWAAAEAARRGRPLHIVTAMDYTQIPMFSARWQDPIDRASRHVLDAAEKLARSVEPGIAVTTALTPESPASALLHLSKVAFETVVGHRGRGGFAGMLLGSTGLSLAGRGSGPIIIVRGNDHRAYPEVLVGVSFADDPRAALDHAFSAAAARGARVRVLHAYQLTATLIEAGYDVSKEEIQDKTLARLAETCKPLRDRYPDIEVTEEAVCEHPVAALTTASSIADLLVIGYDRGVRTAPFGSIVHGAIHHAHCPVAIIRPHTHASLSG